MNVEGMTLLDWFAGMALQRLIPEGGVFKTGKDEPQKTVEYAFRIAEAMLNESKKANQRNDNDAEEEATAFHRDRE